MLGELGDADVTIPLVRLLNTSGAPADVITDALAGLFDRYESRYGAGDHIADLVRLYDSMNDREMKEQLIFVYSQRREEAAVEKLCQIGKTGSDRELRKKALFWIGQSRSQRAAKCLEEVIGQ